MADTISCTSAWHRPSLGAAGTRLAAHAERQGRERHTVIVRGTDFSWNGSQAIPTETPDAARPFAPTCSDSWPSKPGEHHIRRGSASRQGGARPAVGPRRHEPTPRTRLELPASQYDGAMPATGVTLAVLWTAHRARSPPTLGASQPIRAGWSAGKPGRRPCHRARKARRAIRAPSLPSRPLGGPTARPSDRKDSPSHPQTSSAGLGSDSRSGDGGPR